MSEIWFTSDSHWGHANVQRFNTETRVADPTKRAELAQLQATGDPAAIKAWLNQHVDEMDQALIRKWREQVGPKDTVYHLGDVFFCGQDRAREILSELTGTIHLIYGNHDQVIRHNLDIQKRFASVAEMREIRLFKQHVTLCHYPMVSWNRSHHGAFQLYGHTHGSHHSTMRSMDVGVDSRPPGVEPRGGMFSLWNWSEIQEILRVRPVTAHH